MGMIVPLETKRLFLRPLQLSDAAETEHLFAQWEIVKFLNARVPWPFPKGLVLRHYRDVVLPAIERGEEWHWSLRLKESPERLIGKISLEKNEWDNRGYWLGLPWQGQGLMTEAVAAVNDYWFDVLGFKLLRAPKAVANIASRRISEKTGMHVIATLERDYVSGRLPAEIWEITAEEWRNWKSKTAFPRAAGEQTE
ncbi:MAG TPA: GNAT family N-acetyltransferase [Terriglobales bacterium]|nr:GNAT family N-acetyltransferase [Terriglobales bacterium]